MPLPLTSLIRSALLTALLFAISTAHGFEGKIIIKSDIGSGKAFAYNQTEYWIKGPLYRADLAVILAKDKKPLTGGRVLFDPETGGFFALRQLPVPSKKVGWVYDIIPPAPESEAPATPKTKHSYTATGRTETIAGFRAEEYVAKTETGTRLELWATRELGRFPLEKDAIFKIAPWLDFVLENNLFMLRAVSQSDRVTKHDEVLRIEKITLDEKHFKLPGDAVRAQEKKKTPATNAPANTPAD